MPYTPADVALVRGLLSAAARGPGARLYAEFRRAAVTLDSNSAPDDTLLFGDWAIVLDPVEGHVPHAPVVIPGSYWEPEVGDAVALDPQPHLHAAVRAILQAIWSSWLEDALATESYAQQLTAEAQE
jgi:hypothetical protein